MVDTADRKLRALNLQRVARLLLQILRQQIAKHHLGLTVVKALSRENLQRAEFEGIGLPAINQCRYLRSEVHYVEDHRRSLRHIGQAPDLCRR